MNLKIHVVRDILPKLLCFIIIACAFGLKTKATVLTDTAQINGAIRYVNKHYKESDDHPDSLTRLILQSSERIGYKYGLVKGHRFMALLYFDLGQYEDAVSNLTAALRLISPDDHSELIEIYGYLAEVYRNLRNYDLTLMYLSKIEALLTESPSAKHLGLFHLDMANYYQSLSQADTSIIADSAKRHVSIAMAIYHSLNDKKQIAYCYNTLGMIDKTVGKYAEAIVNFRKSRDAYLVSGNYKNLGISFQNLAVCFWNLNNYDSAIFYYKKAYQSGNEFKLIKLNYSASKDLANLYGELKQFDSAYHYQKLAASLESELFNTAKLRVVREITEKYNYEKANQEKEAQRRNYLIAGLFMVLVLLMLAMRYGIVWRSRKKIRIEKQRSDALLLNILPEKIAEELKETGKTVPQYFPNATILFADIENFTRLSESLTATELINLLDDYFKLFDQNMKDHKLEKIKTIGDAYMAASGVPQFNEHHAIDAVQAAVNLQNELSVLNIERKKEDKPVVNFRIGIHSGSVIAGVVGQQKFQYDIWGDAVNMASRMEATSMPGMVNISESTYNLVMDGNFIFEKRGKIHAKNKGEIEMYFVSSKEYSEKSKNGPLAYGNYTQFNKDFCLRLMEGLSKELTYHGYHHVQDVLEAARVIGASENLTDKDWDLLNTAVLLHDSGFLYGYDDHEERSCKLASEVLPEYGYAEEDIEIIQGMIRATKIPQQPKTIMEKIIADADLEYLGTDRFNEISENLFKEWNNKNIMHDRNLWNQTQVKFISAHTYFTDFCIRNRQWKKIENLESIKKLIK